jgi:hypothetical protein
MFVLMPQFRESLAPGVSMVTVWLSFRWLGQWGASHGLSAPGLILLIIQGQIAVLLSTFGHELGHLIAGWVSGERLRSFRAGPFRLERQNGRWRLNFQLSKFYVGAVSMIQPDLRQMRSRHAFLIMGGPAASLLIGSVSIVFSLTAAGNPWEPYWGLITMIASVSIASFLANLILHKPEGPYSDRARLRQMVINGPWAQIHLAFATLATSSITPARPRDFDIRTIEHAAELISGSERALLLRLAACEHYLDSEQIPEALSSLRAAETLYEQCSFDEPAELCEEFTFINAFYKRDLDAAEMWWEQVELNRDIEIGVDYWRAWAALQLLRGETEDAREAVKHGFALLRHLPPSGMMDFTWSCFEQLRLEIDQPVSKTPESLEGSLSARAAPCAPQEYTTSVEI